MQRIIDMLKGSDKAYHVTELTELLNADKAPGEGDLNKTFVSSAIQRIRNHQDYKDKIHIKGSYFWYEEKEV